MRKITAEKNFVYPVPEFKTINLNSENFFSHWKNSVTTLENNTDLNNAVLKDSNIIGNGFSRIVTKKTRIYNRGGGEWRGGKKIFRWKLLLFEQKNFRNKNDLPDMCSRFHDDIDFRRNQIFSRRVIKLRNFIIIKVYCSKKKIVFFERT